MTFSLFKLSFFKFLQVSTEEEFSDLPRELLLNLLPSEDLHVDSEYQVFQAALSWLEHDVGSRRRFVFDILTFFYFLQVSTEEEFSDLPRELLLNLLPSEDLHVDSEYQVFQAALSWLEHDVGSRRRFVFDILKHVRLPLVPSKQLDEYQAQCRDLSLQVALNRLVRKPS